MMLGLGLGLKAKIIRLGLGFRLEAEDRVLAAQTLDLPSIALVLLCLPLYSEALLRLQVVCTM